MPKLIGEIRPLTKALPPDVMQLRKFGWHLFWGPIAVRQH